MSTYQIYIRLLIATLIIVPISASAKSCEDLVTLSLQQSTVVRSETVETGKFSPPRTNQQDPQPVMEGLRSFCRVVVLVRPANDSVITVELWLPLSNWNHKLMAVGNGGWAGEIYYDQMGQALDRGYAVAATDGGHDDTHTDATFALGHPEKLIDFGYRAVHEMTIKAKTVIASYYGEVPSHSYWNSCSTGGRQGLMEAQRFPDDFDGVIVGAPAIYWTQEAARNAWVAEAMRQGEPAYIPPNKYQAIHDAVLEACDSLDGVRDRVLENPTRCKFDPKILDCKGIDGPSCLTALQIESARKLYGPVMNTQTKKLIYWGLMPGSELGWDELSPAGRPGRISVFQVAFNDPNWNYKMIDFSRDPQRAEQLDHGTVNALNPNLGPFFARGGKLLHYHGWADPVVAPPGSINYYESVVRELGGKQRVSDAYRLFMVPGMGHCDGGDGPDQFDRIDVMEEWVERGEAPERIVASRVRNGKVERTRPLCPYPQTAEYKGSGSIDRAENFVCTARK